MSSPANEPGHFKRPAEFAPADRAASKPALSLAAVSGWTAALARSIVIETPGESMAELAAGLTSLVPRVHVVSGFFRRNTAPLAFTQDRTESEQKWDRNYLMGAYLLDPLYEQFMKRDSNAVLSPREIFPRDFQSREFYQSYYRPYGWRDKISFLVYTRPDVAAFVTLARQVDEPSFTSRELQILRAVLPGVEQVAERVWSQLGHQDAARDRESFRLHRVFSEAYHAFGKAALSSREREVAQLLLKGLAPKSVGKVLNIAPGTVRNHIKHIYTKLNVRSQAALLALFFETLERAADGV